MSYTTGVTVNGTSYTGVTVNGKKVSVGEQTIFKTDENGRKFRKYDYLKTSSIPILDYQDPQVKNLILSQQPVILKGSGLVDSTTKWTLDYLSEHMGTEGRHVFLSKNHKFMYFNENKIENIDNFEPPTKQVEMPFKDFAKRLRSWKEGDERLYYQQMLTDTVGRNIFEDFIHFKWKWLEKQLRLFGWGDLTSNLLLISQPGNVTPVHYDEQQNLFAQVHGYKRVILFHPKNFKSLYPYPLHHPCDRQSQEKGTSQDVDVKNQVDFEDPDFDRFPLFSQARGYEGVVGPGDVLYIPMYWWHYIESTMDSEITTSINFWYKNASLSLRDITFPLSWQQKMTMTRNVEKMLGEALGSPTEVGPFLHMLINGRYPPPDDETLDDNEEKSR